MVGTKLNHPKELGSINMSKDDLIAQARELGYTIKITHEDDHKNVQFVGSCSVEPPPITHCYSLEWTDHEIAKDVIHDLLRWAGLEIETRLTHR